MSNKKILLISYVFPPKNIGGVFRISKFIKYTSKLGWQWLIVTPHENNTMNIDENINKDIPQQTKILRTSSWEPNKVIPYKLHNKIISELEITKTSIKSKIINLAGKLFRFCVNFILLPDDKIFWYFPARRKAAAVISDYKPAIIFSSSPPPTAHLVASALSKKYSIPWVADFRDEWTNNPFHKPATIIHKLINKKLEKSAIKQASRIISISEAMTKSFKSIYSKIPHEKFKTIYNGYDNDDFINLDHNVRTNKFSITYTGNFYGHRNPNFFLQAISKLLEKNAIPQNKIEIIFAGTNIFKINNLTNYGIIKNVLVLKPYLAHAQAIELMKNSTVLLLIISRESGPNSVSGKIFEYLASQRPILGLVPEGEAAEIIRNTKSGYICAPDDVKQIEDLILLLYNKWYQNSLVQSNNIKEISKYSRHEQAKQLDLIFNKLIDA